MLSEFSSGCELLLENEMSYIKKGIFILFSDSSSNKLFNCEEKQIMTLILICLGGKGFKFTLGAKDSIFMPKVKHHPCKRLYGLSLINKHVLTLTPGRALDLQTITQGLEAKNRNNDFGDSVNHSFRTETVEYCYIMNTPDGGVHDTIQ